jgi:hypothetical protein
MNHLFDCFRKSPTANGICFLREEGLLFMLVYLHLVALQRKKIGPLRKVGFLTFLR